MSENKELIERLERLRHEGASFEMGSPESLNKALQMLSVREEAIGEAVDAIEHLERERDEAREAAAFHEHNWRQERDLKLGMAAELTTLCARVARLEDALARAVSVMETVHAAMNGSRGRP